MHLIPRHALFVLLAARSNDLPLRGDYSKSDVSIFDVFSVLRALVYVLHFAVANLLRP